jgi:hypothetical protein
LSGDFAPLHAAAVRSALKPKTRGSFVRIVGFLFFSLFVSVGQSVAHGGRALPQLL